MSARRRALSLVVAVLTVIVAGAIPGFAQDFAFTAVNKTISLGATNPGLNNRGVTGALCASGLVNFGATGADFIRGNFSTCDGFPSVGTVGGLTVESDGDAFGDFVGDSFDGTLLPGGGGFIAVTNFNASVVGGVGLTAVIHPGTTTFSQGDLTGTWRVKSLRGEVFPGTTTEGAFGSLAVQSNGVFATGQSLTLFPSFVSQPILGGNLHMDSPDGTMAATDAYPCVNKGTSTEGLLPPVSGKYAISEIDVS